MRPRGITDEMIARALREAREETERTRRKPEVEAKFAALSERVAAIKREWLEKAKNGDLKAQADLRRLYPEDAAEIRAAQEAAQALTGHWADGGNDE